MDTLLQLGLIMFLGMIGGRIANRLNLPNVSGYIVGGLIAGPSFLKILGLGEAANFNIINEFTLATIAFSIGSEFLIKDIKKMGKDIAIITVAEVLGALALVFVVMYYLLGQSFEFSLVIASMSAATAPAGLLMVVRELKADGKLVRTMLPVVAIDDAVGIMVFGVCLSLAKVTGGTGGDITIASMFLAPLMEIVGSLVLGFVLGIILSYFTPKAKSREELLCIILAFIVVGTGLSNQFNLSGLLTCMTMGGVVVNLLQTPNRVFNLLADFTPPANLLFFSLAGAGLDLSILSQVGVLGVSYIIARALGKILGATAGAKIVNADENVVKYLGMSLLTQGGISIGLSMMVAKELPQFSEEIITVILFSVLVFEIIGPIMAKIAIQKAGEEGGALKNK